MEFITTWQPLILKIMRFIGSKTHGILDYLTGILLIASPWLLDFANGGAAQYVPIVIGILIIVQALMTDYEMGAVKAMPLSMHLTMDVIAGAFLAVSPWLFGFADEVYLPHLVVGIFILGSGLMTKTKPEYNLAITNK